VEGIGDVDGSILEAVLAEPDLSIYTAREPLLTMVYLNLNNPEVNFLQTPDFRRALMMAINRDLIIKNVYNGQAVTANGPIMPGTWAYYTDLEQVAYDKMEAQSLFGNAGLIYDAEADVFLTEDGLEIALTLLHPDSAEHTAIAQQIKADWEALGINVILDGRPYEEVLANLEARDYQTALVDINLTGSPDPDPYPFWGQAQVQSGQNYAEWDNRSASEYLEQARMTVDMGERDRLYRNFQVLFMREMPSLPLFYPVYTYAITDDINGVNMGPIFEPGDRFNNVNYWYILSGKETTTTETVETTIETGE
jgi:peptide/nickel transport system substrate-binding protein